MSHTAEAGANAGVEQTKTFGRARRRRHLLPYALVVPILLYEGILIVYPIIRGVIGSFQNIELASNKPPEWVGLENYQRMFSDPEFWKVMQTTLIFTGLVILVAIGAGLFTALLFNRPFRFRPAARASLMMPWAMPEVPVVMIFIWILNPQFGVINVFARLIPGVTAESAVAAGANACHDVDGPDRLVEGFPVLQPGDPGSLAGDSRGDLRGGQSGRRQLAAVVPAHHAFPASARPWSCSWCWPASSPSNSSPLSI